MRFGLSDSEFVIVEIGNRPVGLLARLDDAVQFFASCDAAFSLNRRLFSSVRDAINAVAEVVGSGAPVPSEAGRSGRHGRAASRRLSVVGG